jgi:hypothetical protein
VGNVIRIRRTSTSNRPTTLADAELALIEGSQILVAGIGTGGANGSATSIVDVGGVGAFLGLGSGLTQTAAGTYTFSGTATFSGTTSLGAATATTASSSDNSTKVATTAYVKSQGYLTSGTYVGTVTSVGLSLPNIFTVSGSPVTSSGTLSASLAAQAAHKVFAGPTSGSDTAPTFRALVSGDLPDLSGSYLPLAGGSLSGNLSVGGNLTVSGTCTINGDTVTVNATTLTVDDKSIELAATYSPSDTTADGGGIVLKGDTDHTLLWQNSTDAWTSSEHVNLASGKAYYINGASVLSSSTLGSGVTSSSLTSVGALTSGSLGSGFTAVAVAQGGTGLTSAAQGSVLVANTANTLSAIDGGGSTDKLLLYTASSDSVSWTSEIDGGAF